VAVFYSFHYKRDAWRVQQVANMGALEGQTILNAQEWEKVENQGQKAIQNWIDSQMKYKTAVVVLIGAQTAGRAWVKYEIEKAWTEKRALVGVRIHGLADSTGKTDSSGGNPFEKVSLSNGRTVAAYVPVYDPAGATSQQVHSTIAANLQSWVANAYKPS
jgi:hypothetical protein